jgi:DDE superfamily endonuclease
MKEMSGEKASKNWISILFICNELGEKEDIWCIGKFKRPQCFKKKDGSAYGLNYQNNKKAWMTSSLFEEIIHALDLKMHTENRHILFWIDNFSGHTINYEPTNIQLEFYEPNLTPFVQPCDVGII